MTDLDSDLDGLIHRADLDGLVRMIDDRCSARDWDGLLRVRDRSRHAVATGRQLWPAATLAEYRLALLAPPPFVATVLDESDGMSGRFTIGPLTEVAAQNHTWEDLAAVLTPGPRASLVADERSLRGDEVDISGFPQVLDIPAALSAWEPSYALAEYTDAGAEFPAPELPATWSPVPNVEHPQLLDDGDATDVERAVQQLLERWTTSSNGRVEVACVEGDAAAAIGALGVRRARWCALDSGTAIAWLAWAGASGGAHGRRRGAASGRFGAWWLLGTIGDLIDDWPVPAEEIGELANELRWYRWNAFEPEVGWSLHLAIEDRASGLAWAIAASDQS